MATNTIPIMSRERILLNHFNSIFLQSGAQLSAQKNYTKRNIDVVKCCSRPFQENGIAN